MGREKEKKTKKELKTEFSKKKKRIDFERKLGAEKRKKRILERAKEVNRGGLGE